MMQALSRHGELTLVLRPTRTERMEVGGKKVVEVNPGVRVTFHALGERAEFDAEEGKWKKRYGIESPLMPMFRGRRTVRGVLDIGTEAKRLRVERDWLVERLRSHPANIANGGAKFILVDAEGEAGESVEPEPVEKPESGRHYCRVCDKSMSNHHLAVANHERSKAHKAALEAAQLVGAA